MRDHPAASAAARWAPYLVVSFIVGVSYAYALRAGFVFDDVMLIVQDQATHNLSGALQFFRQAFLSGQDEAGRSYYFRPLTQLSYALDWSIGRGAPANFHLTNLLAHLGVTALIVAVARRRGASPLGATLGGLLFGVMPRLSESVAWISGRTDVLATLFGLGALLVDQEDDHRVPRRVAVGVLLLASLLSKEVGVAWVVVLGARAGLRVVGRTPPAAGALAALAAPVMALGAWAALRSAVVSVLPPERAPPAQFLAALGTTVKLVLTPWFPNLQVGLPDERPAWAVALGVITLASFALLLAYAARRRALDELALALGAAVALALGLGFAVSPVLTADRLLYVPLAMAAVGVAPRLPARGNALALVLGLLGLSFVPVTAARARLWADELGLWEVSVQDASPRNAGVRVGLFNVYLDRSRLTDAARVIDEALSQDPTNVLFSMNRAAASSQLGRDEEAISAIDALRRRAPDFVALQRNAVLFRLRAGRLGAARELARGTSAHAAAFGVAEVAFAPDAPGGPSPGARAQALAALGATARARAAHRALALAQGDPEQLRASLLWLLRHGERDDAVNAAERLSALGFSDRELVATLTWRFGADVTGD